MTDHFAIDTRKGLSASPKYIYSKYFYNDRGDALFQEIMNMPEYYLTDSELEILTQNAEPIFAPFHKKEPFQLVELGAGDGLKTKVLIRRLVEEGFDFTYVPVDISANVLEGLQKSLLERYPGMAVKPVQSDYTHAFKDEVFRKSCKKLVLFLGSNIGNYSHREARQFFRRLSMLLNKGDLLLTGFDLVKDPATILAAYDDAAGITARFNLNVLQRINEAFDGDIPVEEFYHYPIYIPETGEAKSYLVAKSNIQARLRKLDFDIYFQKGECIFTEVSKKYTIEEIEGLCHETRFTLKSHFYDSKRYFADSLWEKV